MCFILCMFGMFWMLCIFGLFCIWLTWKDYDRTRADKKLSPFLPGPASQLMISKQWLEKDGFLTPSLPFRTNPTSLVGEERLCWAPKSQECGLPSVDGEPPRQTHTLLLTKSEQLGKQNTEKLENHTRCLSRTRNNFENTTLKYLTNTPIANYCTMG